MLVIDDRSAISTGELRRPQPVRDRHRARRNPSDGIHLRRQGAGHRASSPGSSRTCSTMSDHVSLLRPGHRDLRPARRHRLTRDEAPIVLTPHTTEPLPRDQLLPSEADAPSGRDLQPRLHRSRQDADALPRLVARAPRADCLVDVEQGIFVDQRWIDFVPALFEHDILGDTAATSRTGTSRTDESSGHGASYEVDGAPLRFFHYSGFSPGTMELSTHMGDGRGYARRPPGRAPPLHGLCRAALCKRARARGP